MEINYFREFVILAETKNYWAAADRLFIGESSLSKHIKTMEKQLGGALFDRTSRKVQLSEFGAALLPYAQSIAKLQDEYETAAFNFLNVGSESLTIACIPAMAQYNITNILINFQRSYPKVQVHTLEEDTIYVRELLLEQKCDLGIYRDNETYLGHDPVKEGQLVKIPYCEDHLVAVLPKNHPLAGQNRVELNQLKDEFFSLIRKDTMPYTLCVQACREAGFTPKILFTSHNLDAVLDMVTQGSCVSLLFANHVAYPVDSVLSVEPPFAVVPVAPDIRTTIYLSYMKDVPLSRPAKAFIEHCTLYRDNLNAD